MTIKEIYIKSLQKLDMTDAQIIEPTAGRKRVLLVDLEVSRSGKVINGRIYPPAGQRNTLDSWTKPFEKPVLLNHDDNVENTVGRFNGAEYQDLEREALDFLKGDVGALAAIKRAFTSGNAKTIVSTMKKHNALDAKWPGLGRVIGKVRILDPDAIDKVLDGRYNTVSAGQGTDALTCGTCNAEWHKGDMCDHRMGSTDEDGELVVFVCGNMRGKETSFVSMPANDTSFALNMQLADDATTGMTIEIQDMVASETTPTMRLEKDMNLTDLQALEIPTVIDYLNNAEKLKEFTDAINGDTQYEISWLIRVHDALHSQYDYDLKYNMGSDDGPRMPMAVYALHGAIHDTAGDKGFRDSLINGELDGYDSTGAESAEYQIASEDTTTQLILTDEQMQMLVDKLATLKPGVTTDGHEKEKEEDQVRVLETLAVDEEMVNDDTIDWEILDLALEATVGDAKLSTEKRKALATSTFCGPDRSFPVPDCAHATAARRLIGKSKLSTDQKARVLACVERKAKGLGCRDAKDCNCSEPCKTCSEKDQKIVELTSDFAQAVKIQQDLKDQLTSTLKKASQVIRPDVDVADMELASLLDWAAEIGDNQVNQNSAQGLAPVENPSITSNDHTASDNRLTGFQKQVVKDYESKLKEKGEKVATKYLASIARFLPRDFKIEQYVKSTKE